MYWAQPFGAVDDILAALQEIECRTFFRSTPYPKVVDDVLARHALETFETPSLDNWLHATYKHFARPYEYCRDLDTVATYPLGIFQTSETTGLPKPITVRLGSCSALDLFQQLPALGERPITLTAMSGKRVLSTFGWYQYAGLVFNLITVVFYDCIAVLAPAIQDWDADLVDAVHVHGNVQGSYLYPALCVEIAQDGRKLQNLRSLDFVAYGGSSIPLWVGNMISRYTDLFVIYGTTEAGVLLVEVPTKSNTWPYFTLSPRTGHEYQHFSENFYELVIRRREHLQKWQAVFLNFPDVSQYHTGDLFTQHAYDRDLWRPAGRIADLLEFTNGQRFNPVPIESGLGEDPTIELAMICGRSGDNMILLLDPTSDHARREGKSFILSKWSFIAATFKSEGPSWLASMIHPEYVHVASEGKAIFRTGGKWNVNRIKTLPAHRHTLELLYGPLDTGTSFDRKSVVNSAS